jgi:uncharacterized membrane protein
MALAFTALAGIAGLGTEAASWYFTQRAMQGAADAAAHSAAAAKSTGADATAFTTGATSVAASFNFASAGAPRLRSTTRPAREAMPATATRSKC